jgi:hypothetical protein
MFWFIFHPLRSGLPSLLRVLDILGPSSAAGRLAAWRGGASGPLACSQVASVPWHATSSPAAAEPSRHAPLAARGARGLSTGCGGDGGAASWLARVGFAAAAYLAALGGSTALADAAEPVGWRRPPGATGMDLGTPCGWCRQHICVAAAEWMQRHSTTVPSETPLQSMAEALQEAQLHVDRAWVELSQDWERTAAMRPPGSKVCGRPPPPPSPRRRCTEAAPAACSHRGSLPRAAGAGASRTLPCYGPLPPLATPRARPAARCVAAAAAGGAFSGWAHAARQCAAAAGRGRRRSGAGGLGSATAASARRGDLPPAAQGAVRLRACARARACV